MDRVATTWSRVFIKQNLSDISMSEARVQVMKMSWASVIWVLVNHSQFVQTSFLGKADIGSASLDEQVLHFENFDLENIITPVKAEKFIQQLKATNYNLTEIQFLEEGFTEGFNISYEGPTERQSTAANIPLTIGTKTDLWNKLMKEVSHKSSRTISECSIQKLHTIPNWTHSKIRLWSNKTNLPPIIWLR